jgi:menaquinone-dependent protoporphyrinogen oxidase
MDDRILVAYATAAGSTGEVAEAIGEALREEGAAVDVRRAKKMDDVSGYGAVVVGTGVRAGRPYQEAVSFVEKNQQALGGVRVAYFLVCMTMGQDTAENRNEAETFLSPVLEAAPQVEPVAVGLFGGELDYGKLPLPLRLVMKAMKRPEGDVRDWEAIGAWAREICPKLLG